MKDWQPISTAPKDGTEIIVMHEDCGEFPMYWNPSGKNALFAPGVTGLWEMKNGAMTWKPGEDGPSRWKPLFAHSAS